MKRWQLCLSPYIFTVFHSDFVKCTDAFSTHIFADDPNVLIRATIEKKLEPMLQFLEKEGTKVCNELFQYARRWKQSINVSKLVYQVFYSQINLRFLIVTMNNIPLEYVNDFEYLGYNWTSKLFMRKTVENCFEKVQRLYTKLK